MRTTLDLNTALLARAKAEAARQRTTLTRLIEEGLALRLDQSAPAGAPRLPFRWATHGDPAPTAKLDWATYAARVEAAEHEYDRRQAGLLPFEDSGDAGA